MIIKKIDSKEEQIKEIQALQRIAPPEQKFFIEKELKILKAGLKGEKEAAYFIDFDFKNSNNQAIIHDLRLEINGRIAQIDHLMINRMMMFYVFETKHFHSGLKIDDDGQFLRWNSYSKAYEGMPSPLAQNERHITVLKDAVQQIEWPTRLGLKLAPSFDSCILISSQSRVDRPKKFDTSKIVKADEFRTYFDKKVNSMGVISVLGAASKIVSSETLEHVANSIAALHSPIKIDYTAKFNISSATTPVSISVNNEVQKNSPICSKCGSKNIAVTYGRYGYYFKCESCSGNTAIKLMCEKCGKKERIRKDKEKFYRECSDCGSSTLYFKNKN